MPVQWQNIPIDLTGGLDQKSDSKYVLPGGLVRLENARQLKTGELRKRSGYQRILIADQNFFITQGVIHRVTAGHGLSSGAGMLLAHVQTDNPLASSIQGERGHSVLSYGAAEATWRKSGPHMRCSLKKQGVTITRPASASYAGAAGNDDYLLFCFELDGHKAIVIDRETGAVVTSNETGANTIQAFRSESGVLMALSHDPSSLQVHCADTRSFGSYPDSYYFLSGSSFGGAVSFADAIYVPGVGAIVATGNGTTINIYSIDDTGDATLEDSFTTSAAISGHMNLFYWNKADGSARYGLAYGSSIATRVVAWSSSHTQIKDYELVSPGGNTITRATGASALDQSTDGASSGNDGLVRFFVEFDAGSYSFVKTLLVSDNGNVRSSYDYPGFGIASKAFTAQNKPLCWLTRDDPQQGCLFLVGKDGGESSSLSDHNLFVVARAMYGRHDGPLTGPGALSNVAELGSSKFAIAAASRERLLSDGAYDVRGIGLVSDLSPVSLPTITAGERIYGCGGALWQFDGEQISETSQFFIPPTPTLNTAASSGGGLTDGVRSYVAVFEWTDRQGGVHRSPPSTPLAVTLSGGTSAQTASIDVQDFRASLRSHLLTTGQCDPDNGTVALFRTIPNGLTYYRVTEGADSISGTHLRAWQTVDGTSDADIVDNEILYTTGGALENYAAGASSSIAQLGDYIYTVYGDEPNRVYVSKKMGNGDGLAFNPSRYIDVFPGGPITALAPMDGQVFVFGESEIRGIAGSIQNDLGQGEFGPSFLIAADAGHVSGAPIVSTSLGIFIRSRKGTYLLTRSRETRYIGSPIEDLNDETLVAAVLMERDNEVRLAFANGSIAAFDLFRRQWGVDTGFTDIVDAVEFNGVFAWMNSSGSVFLEDSSVFTDNDVSVGLSLRTGWIKPVGIQGFQRIRRLMLLGEKKSDHSITINIYLDYDDETIAQTVVIDNVGAGPLQERIRLSRQKCEAIMVEIIDSPDVTEGKTGESFTLSNLSLEVGLKRGLFRKEHARS